MKNPYVLLVLISFALVRCSEVGVNKKQEYDLAKKQFQLEKNEVSVIVLKQKSFKRELLSNGKLTANQKSVLKFKINGNLKKLLVQNGELVKKGQVLASLDAFVYHQTLTSAEISFKKASLEFEDMLVGRGYDIKNREEIPDNIYEMVTIRSGYAEAENQLNNARYDVNSAILRAPFSGKVADIQFKEFEQVSSGIEFMTLIDDTTFEVVFYMIESEINQVAKGEHVEVLAFNSKIVYEGKILSINPIVEKNGMVQIKALVKNDGNLLEGMNVKVRIQEEIPNKLVVPKEAVILRQNQEVLFKYQDGMAFWTYVKITEENNDSYAVIANPNKSSASLKLGDTIIVSGNLNLAHDSNVVIKTE